MPRRPEEAPAEKHKVFNGIVRFSLIKPNIPLYEELASLLSQNSGYSVTLVELDEAPITANGEKLFPVQVAFGTARQRLGIKRELMHTFGQMAGIAQTAIRHDPSLSAELAAKQASEQVIPHTNLRRRRS